MSATRNFRVAGFVTGLAIKAPVRTFTTGPITLSGLQTVNSFGTSVGDRVLVKDQADPIENGIYTAQISAWRRDGDWDGNRDVVGGTIVPAYRPTDGEIVLYNVDGQPATVEVGTDPANFSEYFDPNNLGGGEDLQATTVLGNTTDQGMDVITGALFRIFDAADVENVSMGVNATILAPAPALEFLASANIEAYQFDESINIDGGNIHFSSDTARVAFYRYGDAVSSHIRSGTGTADIEYVAVVADHIFTGDIISNDNLRVQSNASELSLGAADEFSILHNGVNTLVDHNEDTGDLVLTVGNGARERIRLGGDAAGITSLYSGTGNQILQCRVHDGVNGNGQISATRIKDKSDTFVEAGFAVMRRINVTGAVTALDNLWHKKVVATGACTLTFNTADHSSTDDDAVLWAVANGGALTLAEGTGMTIRKFLGGGVSTTGNAVIADGGWATVTKHTDTEIWVTGLDVT